MQDVVMVRSRLKDVVKGSNLKRIQADQPIWSVRSLAMAADVASSSIQALMTGKAERVDFKTLDKLCRLLECTPGDLLEYVPTEDEDDPTS